MDSENNLFFVRAQLYDKAKYVVTEKKDIGDWEIFIRNGMKNITSLK